MIKNRADFEHYLLAMLGEPITKVNVTKEQLEFCVNDGLQYFTMYHYEGHVKMYLQQIITPSVLKVDDWEPGNEFPGAKIEGLTSHTESYICTKFPGDHRTDGIKGTIYCERTIGNFLPGEKIKINNKQYTVSNTVDCFKKGIIDEHKIKMPDWIIGVTNIVPSSQALSSQNLFDLQYQLRLNDFNATQLTTQSLIYYEQAMEHISLLNWELTAKPDFNFNQYDGWLYPHTNWGYDFCAGDYMLIECYRSHDLDSSKVFNEPWLKSYCLSLVKRCYAQNLKKYQNLQLPGGVTFNADQMYQEAQTEIDKLEQQIQGLSWPSAFMIG